MHDGYCAKPRKGWQCVFPEGHVGRCDEWPKWLTSVLLWIKGK